MPTESPRPETAPNSNSWTDLSAFTVGDYHPGAGRVIQLLWYLTSLALFESGWMPVSAVKRSLLRWFGAKIGRGVVIKPHVRIKYPWRLEIGDNTWIGQNAWIDNFVPVKIGSHACVSQDVYLCTGSHDHRVRTFDLVTGGIAIGDGAWVAARSTLLPGVSIGDNAVAAAGSVVTKSVEPAMIVAGVPARVISDRQPPQ